MTYDNNQEFTNRNINPNSSMNNLMFSIDMELSKVFNQFGYSAKWKKFFISHKNEKKDNNPTQVVIEFNVTKGERNTIDWIDATLRGLNIKFKYINTSDLSLMEYLPISHGNSGRIIIDI